MLWMRVSLSDWKEAAACISILQVWGMSIVFLDVGDEYANGTRQTQALAWKATKQRFQQSFN